MKSKRKKTVAAWKRFMSEASFRKSKGEKWFELKFGQTWEEAVAGEIVAHGDGPAFLKAVRRGRPTQKQNLRYQLLREVERLAGADVKRRRVDSNTPDALALKAPGVFALSSPD